MCKTKTSFWTKWKQWWLKKVLPSFNKNTFQSVGKHLVRVELDMLRFCPGRASVNLLSEFAFSMELWLWALNRCWTRTLCYSRSLVKTGLCATGKWRSGNVSVIRQDGWVPERSPVAAIGQKWVTILVMQYSVVTFGHPNASSGLAHTYCTVLYTLFSTVTNPVAHRKLSLFNRLKSLFLNY